MTTTTPATDTTAAASEAPDSSTPSSATSPTPTEAPAETPSVPEPPDGFLARIEEEASHLVDDVRGAVGHVAPDLDAAVAEVDKVAPAVTGVAETVAAGVSDVAGLVSTDGPHTTEEKIAQDALGLVTKLDPALAPMIATLEKVVSVIDSLSASVHASIATIKQNHQKPA